MTKRASEGNKAESSEKVTGRARKRGENITSDQEGRIRIVMPSRMKLSNDNLVSFEAIFSHFDWSIRSTIVVIDVSKTRQADSPGLVLLMLYAIHLQFKNSCSVEIQFPEKIKGNLSEVEQLWDGIGGNNWKGAVRKTTGKISCDPKSPSFSIKSYDDFDRILDKFEIYTNKIGSQYANTLRYVASELIFNAIEHGHSMTPEAQGRKQIPAIITFVYLRKSNELHLLVADLGIGIKRHLENYIPGFDTHSEAIIKSLEPKISGTFGQVQGYKPKNNAGFGLYMSSSLARDLRGDMYMVSYNGRAHISPQDMTRREMSYFWPGTLAFVKVKLNRADLISIEETMSKIRQNAQEEIREREKTKSQDIVYFSMHNYFGRTAENKSEAINFRDRYLLPAVREGKNIKLDFADVNQSVHSFLNAMLADAVVELGEAVYRRIKIVNAASEIRDTIDYVFEDNIS